jgi:cobalt-zinc-cadmium efflux system outer membrane protein
LTLAQPFELTGPRGTTGGFDEGVLASQTIELFGKRSARTDLARKEASTARFDLAGSGTTLDFAVRSAYFEVQRAQAERDLAATTLQNAQAFSAAAQTQEKEGDVPRRDVLRAQTEVDRAQTALDQADSDLQTRRATLASLIGLPEDAPFQLSDPMGYAPFLIEKPSLEAYALEHRADVQSTQASTAAKLAGIAVAKAAGKPDAFVEFRSAQLFPQSGDTRGTSIRAGITMPLIDLGSNRAGVREARAELAEQAATNAETIRTARLEVESAINTLEAAAKAVESFEKGRLSRADELLDMAQTGYQEGANSFLEVLDARTVYRTERTDYLRALAAYNTALADLQRAAGGTLPTSANGETPKP